MQSTSFDVVLPLRCRVPYGRESDLERVIGGLLPSLLLNKLDTLIDRFTIIVPADDLKLVLPAIEEYRSKLNCQILTDDDFLEFVGFSAVEFDKVRPWFRQQLIKLCAVANSNSQLCLVLDSDVISVRPLVEELLQPGKWPYSVTDASRRSGWFSASATALQLSTEDLDPARLRQAMGVTPEFLSPEIMRELIAHLKQLAFPDSWGRYLMRFFVSYASTWTEYSLYWTWYSARGRYDDLHRPAQLFTFLQKGPLPTYATLRAGSCFFAVLQSTKLSLAECKPIYESIASLASCNMERPSGNGGNTIGTSK